ncbi:MAG: hypothetical protein CL912_09200 [Deltaproteobacteria bacterium]|nr:hypothetical protein [Deltaproteobacteria bacterium]
MLFSEFATLISFGTHTCNKLQADSSETILENEAGPPPRIEDCTYSHNVMCDDRPLLSKSRI